VSQRQALTPAGTAERSDAPTALQEAAPDPAPYAGVLRLQRAAGNRAVASLVQAKLLVSVPGDRHEQEADRLAAEVVRMPSPGGPMPTPAVSPRHGEPLQRCPGGCLDQPCDHHTDGSELVVRRTAAAAGTPAIGHGLERRLGALHGGRRLDEHDRRFFEQRLRVDLGGVRIHTGAEAAATSQSFQARAFTLGTDIVFDAGQYAPGTPAGRQLLAHELVHVVQQGGATRTAGAEPDGTQLGPQLTHGVPAATVQRQCSTVRIGVAVATGDTTALAGELWLCLDQERKQELVDLALDGAAKALAALPTDPALGVLWPLFKAGLEGFVERLRSPAVKAEEKVRAMDKIAGILAGRNTAFNLAFLKGLAKGFFLDGMLGIFILVYEVVTHLRNVWTFLGQVREAVEGFPDEIEELVETLEGWYDMLVKESGPALDEVKKWAEDPRRVLELLSSASTAVTGFIREKGGDLAEALVQGINKPGSEQAVGEFTGRITGLIAWEAVFAAVTAGGGAAVSAAKAGLKTAVDVLRRLAARVVGSFLKLFRELHALLAPMIGWVRKAVEIVKGKIAQLAESLAGLLEKLREFFARLLRLCTESKLSCKWPRHHPFPKYLGGLAQQTLKKIPRSLHYLFHSALDKWKGGALRRMLSGGIGQGVGFTFAEIVKELRQFYRTGAGGKFAKYLPDFEAALKETRAAMKAGKLK
jgi:hypothetical protein